jgi:NADH pyrophosphatase NudC (nudix superfamily)
MLCGRGVPHAHPEFVLHWGNVPVVAALVCLNGQYVLARNIAWPANAFSLITGFVEAGESPEAAANREAIEELGLRVTTSMFIGHFPLRHHNQLLIAFALEASGVVKRGQEIAETKAVSRDELATYDFGPLQLTREIVDRWLQLSPVTPLP